MKLTKKRAIELTLELWEWLYKNPDKQKKSWPGWESNGGKHKNQIADCFCCEYTFNMRQTDCNVWPKTCPRVGTPFFQWINTTGKNRNKSAKQIVDFCKKELAGLQNKKIKE